MEHSILRQLQHEQPNRKIDIELMKEVVAKAMNDSHMKYLELFQDLNLETCKQIVKSSSQGSMVTIDSPALTYGEVDFNSYAAILALLNPSPGSVLIDLGSGVGKAVIATALLYGSSFKRVHGVEIIRELYDASTRVCEKYRTLMGDEQGISLPTVTFGLGDFLQDDVIEGEYLDWTSADIVFVNSTCFDSALMIRIGEQASTMRPKSRLVTLTCELPSEHFELVQKHIFSMSWGAATCFIYSHK